MCMRMSLGQQVSMMAFLGTTLINLKTFIFFACQANYLTGHHFSSDKAHMAMMRNFSQTPGVMASFENSIVTGEFFLGYHGWENLNRKYGVSNVSYIVRIEFDRWTYRHNRLRKTYHRYWIPGATWVEMLEIERNYYTRSLNYTRSKNSSVIDIWVEPKCFLKNHGISRIYRVTRSLRMHVYNLRWMAKISFMDSLYQERELKQFGKFLVQLSGLDCAWIHPRSESSYSLLVRFDESRVGSRRFFSPDGYHSWDDLNSQYQVIRIGYLKGWNRAILDFQGGLHCQKTSGEVALLYGNTPGIQSVYRDEYKNCRMTFRILVQFDRRYMTPASIHHYNDWSSLNYMYGVTNISYHEDEKLIAHLEFEPGLYTNHQMKAIRSEYLKLKGILFAWVEGIRPSQHTRFGVKFQLHLNLMNYSSWNSLNTKYFAQVESINHNRNEVIFQLPEGRYTPEKIKSIYQDYKDLHGALSVDVKPLPGTTVHDDTFGNGLKSLRRKIWTKVTEVNSEGLYVTDLPKEKESRGWFRYTPLYHKCRKAEHSLWEDHCSYH